MEQGIYPIKEESSSALATDPSAASHGQPPRASGPAAPPPPPASGPAPPPPPYYGGTGDEAAGGFGEGGVRTSGPKTLKGMVSGEDIRRRREAAQLAAQAQQANSRTTDWSSKFAG
ncbi:hypothetical protein TSOC_002684 [Tetrabaena socialis]|uniref:Uncharacterized protein n=1 Tax=Tetrabaena socialis TaxID=47790 RepID=A0A2J8ADI9_9CHLO|nr:hypothetical protein TSOC_002684 [Tetrabaena socialis]|eukprot:PNH10588.1 hypothetical protein TSOC_002684 [Tetrabaena socialis]